MHTVGVPPPKKVDLQIRGVPGPLRDRLRKRAGGKGLSMSQYVIQIIRDDLERPTMEEWRAQWRKLPIIDLGGAGARAVREIRDLAEEGIEED